MELENLGGFPRPDMARSAWQPLDGEWDFDYDPEDRGSTVGWQSAPRLTRAIKVPFCVESEASGVGDPNPPGIIWYARRFEGSLPETPGRTLLHFGAVDYRAMVWLNGEFLGEHCGGYTPFRFEVSLKPSAENLLVVRVQDSRSPSQPRGKQTMLGKPFLVFYPGVTGIWQPVWLERAGNIYLDGYRVYPDLERGRVLLRCSLAGCAGSAQVSATAGSPRGQEVTVDAGLVKGEAAAVADLLLDFGDLLPWSPEEPNLYSLKITVDSGGSKDVTDAFFGARTIEARDGQVLLNGEPLYQKLALCQGYYPGGHYTPTDPAAYREDVRMTRELGFNGLRVHQKIEDPRFLFWCDLLGCLVWEEMPSAHRFGPRMREALESEWRDVIERDFNHPSIITRAPFNESWGLGVFPLPLNIRRSTKDYLKRVCRLTREWDPTRPVIDNSGYDHSSGTDIVDVHHYLGDLERCRSLYSDLENLECVNRSFLRSLKGANPAWSNQNAFLRGERYRGQPIIISEYGGFGFYRSGEGSSLLDDFSSFTRLIREQGHIRGYCYTQLYDTYQEKNGLLDFERRQKVPAADIARVNHP